jgi:hypothetical protein
MLRTVTLALGALALMAMPAAASCTLAHLSGTWLVQNQNGSCLIVIKSTGAVLSEECEPGTATIASSTCAVSLNLGAISVLGRSESVAGLLSRRPNLVIGQYTDSDLDETGLATAHRLSNLVVLPVSVASAKKHKGL